MLQSKLNNIYDEAVEKVLAANIPLEPEKITKVSLNTRAKKRWGQCSKLPNGNYEISINSELVNQSEEGTLNTCIHELIHTINGCFNHGEQWKIYANIINSKYGIDVKRASTADEKGIEEVILKIDYKYILQCEKCNHEFKRTRRSQFVDHPESYRCSCGGKIKRIK
jgi:predicted SprT family Zn-dependent metalloprotease